VKLYSELSSLLDCKFVSIVKKRLFEVS